MLICPAAVAHAPLSRVWTLLSEPRLYDQWWEAETVAIEPSGSARPGQRITMRSRALGSDWTIVSKIQEVDQACHVIRFVTHFPLGLTIHTRVSCVSCESEACRIQYG